MRAKKLDHINKGEKFLLSTLKNGLAHSYDVLNRKWVKPYPEVTGYLLSYFSQYYEEVPPEILYTANHLAKIQHKTGGFPSFYAKKYLFTFDTAQIMHGFGSLYKKTNEDRFLQVAINSANFIVGMQLDNGSMFPIYDTVYQARYVNTKANWGGNFSSIQVKNIEGLLLIYELTDKTIYLNTAEKLAEYGEKFCDLTYTHPGAYCLEGMLAYGQKEFVLSKLKEEILPNIETNGFLPYSRELKYSYVSGSAQMGILLHKVGLKKTAIEILKWLRKVQANHTSGGLFQYANPDSSQNTEIHAEINSWGTKYYVQLERFVEEI